MTNPTVSSTRGPDLTMKEFALSRVKERATSKVQSTERKCPVVGRQTQQVTISPQQVTSPVAGDNEDITKYETSHIQSSSDYHGRLQGTTPAKRAHSSIEALKKKVPVPKLPGASDIHKMPTSQSEKTVSLGHRATGEPRLQFQVQDKEPTSSTNLDNSYKGSLSHNDGHPLASIAKHDFLSPIARSFENNFPADLTGIVAPTQIDIDLTSDISRTSQEEITKSSCCDQKEVYHDSGNNSSPAEEINAKELATCSGCPKEIKHQNIHNHTFEYSQTLPQALQGADSDDRPTEGHAFSPEWAKDLCQLANYSPTEPQQSCADVCSTSSLGKSLPYSTPYVPQEIDGSLDKSLIDEIDMLGSEEAKEVKDTRSKKAEEVKRSTGEVEKDCSEYPFQEQLAPESNISPHDSTVILPDPEDQPAEHGIHKSKPLNALNALLDDPIVPEVSDLSSSFTGRRILTHLHTLKQLVASKTSLVNMEFGENDLVQAAKLFDNLNATACFYTAALRLLSKPGWQEPVDFEEHIAHQAMIAVAKGWTTAIGVKTLPFDKHYLALSMATLPLAAHGEVKRAYDNIVATLPSPFREKTSSKVAFTCRVCGKKASHDIPTFIVLEPLEVQADSHDYFKAAVPWTENLLPAAPTSLCDALPNCQECAFDSSWVLEAESSCKLVWLQTPKEFHPQALLYMSFLGKDPFFAMGRSWKCVSVVVHQGRDPLNGADQPSEHLYVFENDGPKSDYFCYNNAVGLHYVEDTKIKPGDRICAFLFRTADITTKWPVHCTLPNRKLQKNNVPKQDKGKRSKNGRVSRILLSSKKRVTSGKQSGHLAEKSMLNNVQDTYSEERYDPPDDDLHIVPIETIESIEEVFSQPQVGPESMITEQQGNGDPRRCSSAATGAPQRFGNSPSRPGPYSSEDSKGRAGLDKNVSSIVNSLGDGETSKPPYAILSMFDGCGSSVDIIESKIGYRPKACILCEKDETLRYLVGENMASLLIRFGNTAQKEEEPFTMPMMLTTFLLTMHVCCGSSLPSALIVTSLSLWVALALI